MTRPANKRSLPIWARVMLVGAIALALWGGYQLWDAERRAPGEDALSVEILDLHAALSQLAEVNPRLGRIVELRFFGGLSLEETAEALEVSRRTVDRDWLKAKGMLSVMLRQAREA